jgi:hypothetical protein
MAEESAVTQESTEQEPQGTEEVDWEAKYKEAVAQSRKWESRAKANSDKAAKWDEYEQQGMSEQEKLAKRAESAEAELAQLKAESKRRADADEVAKATGVPASLLLHCADREDMEAFAKEYAGVAKVPAAPSASQSRVIRGGEQKQTTRDKFASYFE